MRAALISTENDVDELIEIAAVRNRSPEFSMPWRWSSWTGAEGWFALLTDPEGTARWLGTATGSRSIATGYRSLRLHRLVRLSNPFALEELRASIPSRHRTVLDRRGQLPPAGGRAVVDALLSIYPDLAAEVARLSTHDTLRLPPGDRGQLLALERDAVGLVAELAGVTRGHLRAWTYDSAASPFLAGLPATAALEDQLIAYDVERFAGWTQVPTTHVEFRVFEHEGRRVVVMNANRSAVERVLGVDVVYLNETANAFVLVQYKRLVRERVGGVNVPSYRPDGNLDVELDRMRRLDCHAAEAAGPFRLLATPCWFKLVDADRLVPRGDELLRGMYLARAQFEELRNTCVGPSGGTRFGYDNVSSYLTNTSFVELVEKCLIGSRGVASDTIARLIRESLERGRSVVFGLVRESDP